MKSTNPTIYLHAAILALWLGGCTRDGVSLGDDSLVAALIPSDSCAAQPSIDGDVRVTDQAELQALAGCERISGQLAIEVFPGTDLRPLASLRAVGGELIIGDRSSTLAPADYEALTDAGWLDSFEGVENLERVGMLTLVNFAAPDLSAFSGLRYINAADPRTRVRSGDLSIEYAKTIVNLRGLEQVDGIQSMLVLDTPALESLEGVTVADRFDNIMLQKAPRLKNIDALAPLERGNSLSIGETGVEDLWSLSSLIAVDFVTITDNPLLSDASSIPSPTMRSLAVTGNAILQGTLEVASASGTDDITIALNPELGRIAFNDREVHLLPWTCGSFDILSNESLRAITTPNGCDQADVVRVNENPSLEVLDLGRLRRLNELHISDNPGLFALTHAEFERIYVVDVVNNPLLSSSPLTSVPAFERTLQGNAD